MANEGTEGFVNLNTGSGKSDAVMGEEDYLNKGINKVLKARQMAQEERAYAEREAAEQGLTLDELGFGKNHFMMKSLGHEFGGDFIEQQVQKKKWLKSGKRFKLGMQKFAKDLQQQTVEKLQKSSGIGGENVKIDKESQSRLRKSLWKNMDAEGTTISALRALEVPDEVEPNDKLVPDTLESTAKAASGAKSGKSTKVTREDILNSLMEISKSLGQTAASINQNVSSNSALASSVSELNSGVISSLSERTKGIEERLDDIAAAIKNQTTTAVGIVDQKQGTASIADARETKDGEDTVPFNDLTTKVDEAEEDVRDEALEGIADLSNEDDGGGEPPKAEHGGLIVKGDKGGYPYDLDPNIPGPEVELHGTEKLIPTPEGIQVIPIDNNATDGIKGNEVTPGGDIGPPPKAEMGGLVAPAIQNSPPPKSPEAPVVSSSTSALSSPSPTPRSTTPKTRSTTPKTGIVKLPKFETGGVFGKKSTVPMDSGITNSGAATKMAQPVMDAMSLPMMVAGGTILSASSKLKSALGPISSPVSKEIDSFARPVADIFGLPNTLTKKAMATSSTTSGGLGDGLDGSNKSMKKKEGNWLDKMGDFFKGLFENKKKSKEPPGGPGGPSNTDPGAPVNAPDLKTAIRRLESGNDYGSMYKRNRATFSRGKEDITKMTIDEVDQLQTDYLNHQASLGYGENQRSAAMGAYQMLQVKSVAKGMGLDTSTTLFNKETQDLMSNHWLNRSGYQEWKRGEITDAQFNDRLAGAFASIKKTSGSGAYDGDGMNNAYGNIMPLLKKLRNTPDLESPTTTAPASTAQNQNPKPGDGKFEGQIKKVQSQGSGRRHGPKWFKWKQDSTGKWSWWSQKGVHAVQAQKDYVKQQLAPAAPASTKAATQVSTQSPTSQPPTTAIVVPSQQQRSSVASTAPVPTKSGVNSAILDHCGASLNIYYGGTCAAAIHG